MMNDVFNYGFNKVNFFYKLYKKNGGKFDDGKCKSIIRAVMGNMNNYMIETGEKIEIPFFGEIYIVKEKKKTLGRRHYLTAGIAEYMYHFVPFRTNDFYMKLYTEPLWFRTVFSYIKKSRLTRKVVRNINKNNDVTYKNKIYNND